ncbi:hypothetical protein N431DRAFT_558707 [Stipitochalara longipes BDJ]|nr:hypothetical protein N431DRAFT_558707 [Stipitochalara longipes BDJ]
MPTAGSASNDGAGGIYEIPSRLMSKEDVLDITRIMGLRTGSVNNCDILPRPPGGGAGTVNPFKAEERLPFLEPPSTEEATRIPEPDSSLLNVPQKSLEKSLIAREDHRYIAAEIEISGYSFMPAYSSCFHEVVGTQGRQPQINTAEEQSKFPDIEATEVKKRAAWSWYRTHLLYLKSVEKILAEGPTQEALGIRHMGTTCSAEMETITRELRSKAENAKRHALELYPQLLVEEDKYHEELASNYERVQVFDIAEAYKGQAMIYLCEAISLYLEWKENNPKMRDKFTSNANFGQLNVPTLGGAGGPAKLWAEAAKWSQDDETESWIKIRFREWYLRAVMARGHAEWLLEDYRSAIAKSDQTKRRIEQSRLLPPPHVGFYVNDCGPRSILAMIASDEELKNSTMYDDDGYFTKYINILIGFSDLAFTRSGERNYNFAFGAPDAFFIKKATEGWIPNWLGLYPMDGSALNIMTGFYERYCRKGLLDFLPTSSSDYEKALAVCADDMVLEWDHQRYISTFPLLSQKEPTVLPDLEADVKQLVDMRMLMTEAQAERFGFWEKLINAIEYHLSRMDRVLSLSQVWDSEPDAGLMTAARVERILQIMIGPWYTVSVRVYMWTREWYHVLFLGPAEGGVMQQDASAADHTKFARSKPLHKMATYYRLRRIFETLEGCRESILSGRRLDDEEWLFSSCFQRYLETGDENQLPLVKIGIEPKRERTVRSFRKEEVYSCDGQCGCAYDREEKAGVEESAFRQSDDRQAVEQRRIIKQAFSQHNTQVRSKIFRGGQIRMQLLQNIMSQASSAEAESYRKHLADDVRHLFNPNRSGPHPGEDDGSPPSSRQESGDTTDLSNPPDNNSRYPPMPPTNGNLPFIPTDGGVMISESRAIEHAPLSNSQNYSLPMRDGRRRGRFLRFVQSIRKSRK